MYYEPKPYDENTPEVDNPSGMYCPDCRKTGVSHCGYIEECGGMRMMKPKPIENND